MYIHALVRALQESLILIRLLHLETVHLFLLPSYTCTCYIIHICMALYMFTSCTMYTMYNSCIGFLHQKGNIHVNLPRTTVLSASTITRRGSISLRDIEIRTLITFQKT